MRIILFILLVSLSYSECVITGCSGQICAEEPTASDCEYLDWYACFDYSECGNYGSEGNCSWLLMETFLECLDSFGVIVGCTDPESWNYNPDANVDGGSCEYCDTEPGDVDGNGAWNILDVVTLVNCVLADNCDDMSNGCAGDMNGDGAFDVLDIVTLASCVLAENCDS